MNNLFNAPVPRIYSIPAGADFLQIFSQTLVAETRLKDNREALTDTLIYVPTQRAAHNLGLALHRASGHNACLLPDIRPLGELDDETLPPDAALGDNSLAPAIGPAARNGALIRLIMAYYQANGMRVPAVSALTAARELGQLLDQAALSGNVDWQGLADIVKDGDLASHWQQSVQFLNIITDQWPEYLAHSVQTDPRARHHAVILNIIAEWQRKPPQTPVIIAGSTGSVLASRLLMHAVASLPRGIVVLPGLDREAGDDRWSTIAKTPSHPQFILARSLETLKSEPARVATWPADTPQKPARLARRRIIHEALAPADNTADWHERLNGLAGRMDPAAFMKTALSGLSLIESRDDRDEAMIAALAMRAVLQTPDKTAALITPSAGLARHVSTLLQQWNIIVEPSCGLPLAQTDTGSFTLLVADWLTDPVHPVKLLAMLKHRFSRFDSSAIGTLDKAMRGPQAWQDWPGLMDCLMAKTKNQEDWAIVADCRAIFENTGLPALPNIPVSGADWLGAINTACDQLGYGRTTWTGADGARAIQLLDNQHDLIEPLGPQLPAVLNDILRAECRTFSVGGQDNHPRLAIWGPLEARLQMADRIILAGLNEDVWPAQPPADTFVPRVFRGKIGLPDPDERIGLAAHDFAQLAAAPDVMLLTSRRRDDKPAIASRWIWRLRMLARAALGPSAETSLAPSDQDDPRPWLAALNRTPPLADDFSAQPRPCPPLQARPSKLSVSRIEQLIRDPYAVYCRHVLGLYPLDRLDQPPDARQKGTAIHKALERFEEPGQNQSPEALLSLIEQALEQAGENRGDLVALHDNRLEVARAYIAWRNAPDRLFKTPVLTEIRGTIRLDIAGQAFTLSGVADRIERQGDGGIAIFDFKTGKPPSEKQVQTGLAPQMPLLGLIALEGGYNDLDSKAKIAALTYLQIGTKFAAQEIDVEANGTEIPDIIEKTKKSLIALLEAFYSPACPYLSAPLPERIGYESDYARLARRDEWAGLTVYDRIARDA